MKDSVLMIDARNIFRKVTRKIYDFSPEQEQNILAIVWLYRGETGRYLELVSRYCETMLREAESSVNSGDENLFNQFCQKMTLFLDTARPYIIRLSGDHTAKEIFSELEGENAQLSKEINGFAKGTSHELKLWEKQDTSNGGLKKAVDRLSSLADSSHALVTQVDLISKLANRLMETCEKEGQAKGSDLWSGRDLNRILKDAEGVREELIFDLKQVRYFWKQAHWLVERFPDGKYRDVEGLVKRVSRSEIAANDWSLTPGRYVGVAPEEVDEEFDFEEALRDIHIELEGLNAEAVELAGIIQKNFKELGI